MDTLNKKLSKIIMIKSILYSENENNFINYKSIWKAYNGIADSLIKENLLTVDEIVYINYIIIRSRKYGFRNIDVKPFGYEKKYMDWNLINKNMYILIDLYNGKKLKYSELFKNFLEIHPFIDGNGRTIKLIISILIKKQINAYMIWKIISSENIFKKMNNKNFMFNDFFTLKSL